MLIRPLPGVASIKWTVELSPHCAGVRLCGETSPVRVFHRIVLNPSSPQTTAR